MRLNKFDNAISIVHSLMKEKLEPGCIALDATVGNGNDTLLMARLVGETGRIYGFDIQDIAIESTKTLLSTLKFDNSILIKDGHEFIDRHVDEPLDFVVYNLGYLPRGDKTVKTQADTTAISIRKSLEMLKIKGLLCIVAYLGHEGGMEESLAVHYLLSKLDQRNFNVLKLEFINQKNSPPLLYIIEKIGPNAIA